MKRGWFEALGFLGVMASLIFVGAEIRQNTAVARAQARQWMTENYIEYMMEMATNPDLQAAYDSAFRGPQATTGGSGRASRAMFVSLRSLENVYLQVEDGVVDESVFQSYGWVGREEFRTPQFKAWWSQQRHRFNSNFVTAFEEAYHLAP